MTNKRILMICLAIFAGISLQAQPQRDGVREKVNYELAARFSRKKVDKMVFSTSVRPNWFKNSDLFWYEYKTSLGEAWYVADPVKGTHQELFDRVKLAADLTRIVKDPFDAQNLPLKELKLKDDDTFTFYVQSTEMVEKKKKDDEKNSNKKSGKEPRLFFFEYAWKSGTLKWLEDEEKKDPLPRWANISPNREYVVFSRNFDLYWMDWENFEKARKDEKDSTIVEHRLTTTGTRDFPFGSGSEDFYADSTELNKRTGAGGLLWSPDSRHFAIIRSDETKVKDLFVINVLAEPRPKLERYKYEMPGEENIPQQSLVVFNMEDKTWKTIQTAAFKDQSLNLGYAPVEKRTMSDEIRYRKWLGDNAGFYFYRTSRDLKRIDLCRAEIGKDTALTIIEERLNTYVEVRPLCLVNNGKELIHWSEKSGWGHLYLYDDKGNEKNAITSGPWHVEEILGVDEATRTLYFMACGKEAGLDPYYQHLYSVRLDGSQLKMLTPGDFHHTANMSDTRKFFVMNRSRVDVAPISELYDNTGKKLLTLQETDLSLLFQAGYVFPERFCVKAADGITNLYGVMYKPFDFDPAKKYPIITYVYPGPQVEGPGQSWSRSMDRLDRLAQIGFIVISVGNRGGHPNRSKWYHNFGYGNLRDYGLEDQKYAIEQLAARYPFIDLSRVGIHGHSGGGFMSSAAILQYPYFFKVAVSCAGNHENNIYNRWWSEKHHGVLEEITAKGDTTFKYSIGTNSQLAKNLKGRLLLIHGDIDNNVHPGNTLRLANTLIRANKRFDMLILPGQRHGFGDMTEYFFWRMSDYFARYLLGDYENTVDIPQMYND
ncbi:MAG TPA: DPP IV N-terminal domain-containing protein [Bacteroidales bacterium]|nr:MAG: Prolyl tripeptidyl peptidase precursor [Bacteroidetes bacterium ADurb.Bin037]HPV87779.1 DPP IV N-terminal domain-containing protein [Bacteroidales bacterium]HPW78557.1 DPP IV N-terminal domain-containing protein [Bacteroidales bacterium]HQB55768.1 DPP IV N-terminal domain-containing protein [Bacteroidales bacterium]